MGNIDILFKEWQSLQPLKEIDKRRLDQKFMLEFNYNSNHIEGNTLTYGQTELLLKYDEVAENAEWEDFFKRLRNADLIEIDRYNKEDRPIYKLTKAAYEYVDELKK